MVGFKGFYSDNMVTRSNRSTRIAFTLDSIVQNPLLSKVKSAESLDVLSES